MLKILYLLLIFLLLPISVYGLGSDQTLSPKNNLVLDPGLQIKAGASFDFDSNAIFNAIFDADSNTLTNIDDDEIKALAGINVTKLHDGSVNNTEFGHLDGVASQILGKDDVGAYTNKTIDADLNTLSNIENADIKIGANIARAKIQPIDPNAVVINDGSGFLASETYLSKSRGGTGADNSLVTFPTTGTLVTEGGVQTLTNKTIDGNNNTITNLEHGAEVDNPSSGVHGVTGNVVGTTDVQTVSNKFLDGSAVAASTSNQWVPPTDTTANLTTLCPTLTAGSLLYSSDEQKYYLCDSASLIELGTGAGGAGGINYISNPDAEDDTAGWSEFQDTGFGQDLTGGTPVNVLSRNTVSPVIRGAGDFSYSKTASTQYEGISTDFTIDPADQTHVIRVAFDYTANGVNFQDGDMRVYVRNLDSSATIELPVRDLAATARGKYEAYFQAAAFPDVNYRLGIIVADSAADAYTVKFDNFQVGPVTPVVKDPTTVFSVYNTTNQVLNNTTGFVVDWNNIREDSMGGFDLSADDYTIQESGIYKFKLIIHLQNITQGARRVYLRISWDQGSGFQTAKFYSFVHAGGTIAETREVSFLNYMQKGWKIRANVQSLDDASYQVNHAVNLSSFEGYKIASQDASGSGAVKGFYAYLSAAQNVTTTAQTKILFDTELYDIGGNFDTSTSTFIAPESGLYYFNLQAFADSLTVGGGNIYVAITKGGVGYARQYINALSTSPDSWSGNVSTTISLNKGETVEFQIASGSDASYFVQNPVVLTHVSGFKVEGGGSAGAPTDKIRVRAKSSDGQQMTNNIFTEVTYELEDYDTHNAFLNGTFTAPRSAYCKAYAQIKLDGAQSWNVGERIIHRFNCSQCGRGIFRTHSTDTFDIGTVQRNDSFFLNKGDTVFFEIEHNIGANYNLTASTDDNYITIECE